MARISPATLQLLARELYDYELSDSAAASVAHMIGAVAHHAQKLRTPILGGLQPPFSHSTLLAEADRIRVR
ncbi:MAG: hypothetical protein ABSG46_00170 [Candidatus Binataceae bacterium]|jgi:hypothetical protein